jgi:hypothetical protein
MSWCYYLCGEARREAKAKVEGQGTGHPGIPHYPVGRNPFPLSKTQHADPHLSCGPPDDSPHMHHPTLGPLVLGVSSGIPLSIKGTVYARARGERPPCI